MDIYNDDLLQIWRKLAAHNVRYIMIGGVATNLHGFSRYTRDADFFFEDTQENRIRIADAFYELDIAPRDVMLRWQFTPGWASLEYGDGIILDMMTSVKGLEDLGFDTCYRMAVFAEICELSVPILNINHLLRAKEATGRPKDQLDIIELRRLQELMGSDE